MLEKAMKSAELCIVATLKGNVLNSRKTKLSAILNLSMKKQLSGGHVLLCTFGSQIVNVWQIHNNFNKLKLKR